MSVFGEPRKDLRAVVAVMLSVVGQSYKNGYAGTGRSRRREPLCAVAIAEKVVEGITRAYKFRRGDREASKADLLAVILQALDDVPPPVAKAYVAKMALEREAAHDEITRAVWEAIDVNWEVFFEPGDNMQYGSSGSYYPDEPFKVH